MKKIIYLIGISVLFLIPSCNNDDMPQSVSDIKKYTPVVQGTFGQLTDMNLETGTRAGVVENNEDFRGGEKFYWHNGDKVKLLFYQDGELREELIYTATVDEDQPDKARFTTDNAIDPGMYTVYGLYPADGWTVAGDDVSVDYNLTQAFIPVEDATSKHLGQFMFMKADAGEVTIGADEPNAINLDFEQLTSVIRVRVYNTNPGGLTIPGYDQLKQIRIGFDNFTRPFYSIKAQLAGGITGNSFVASEEEGEIYNEVIVRLTDEDLNGFDDGVDFFIPVLPTGDFDGFGSMNLMPFYHNLNPDQTNPDIVAPYPTTLNIPMNQLQFLQNGFEAGKSYYFVINAAHYIS